MIPLGLSATTSIPVRAPVSSTTRSSFRKPTLGPAIPLDRVWEMAWA